LQSYQIAWLNNQNNARAANRNNNNSDNRKQLQLSVISGFRVAVVRRSTPYLFLV